MVSDQESEDDKLQWRIDAEVQAAVRAAIADREVALAQVRELSQQMSQQQSQRADLDASLTAWEAAVAERDAEIVNLQVGT